jgi:DNA (cytosine-5)-methyltransferase 1
MKKSKTARKPNFPVISLFTGAGGLDYGLEAAGFDTAVCVEMDKWCCTTLKNNREWPVIEGLIEQASSEKILETASLKREEAALLVGGPPCQPFSKSGYWVKGDAARLNDPRAQTLHEYMRVLEDTLPQAFILENVFGLAYKGKDEGLVFLRERLNEINKRNKTSYSFEWKVINAAEHGVPQIRERVFIIGSRDGKKFKFPEAMFGSDEAAEQDLFGSRKQPIRTAWDAIGDLDDSSESSETSKVGGQWGDLLPSIPEGDNYLWHTERGGGKPLFGWRSRYWSFLLKLAKNKPSWTIQAQPGSAIGPFHWKNRRLTMREMARIQTFPDDVNVAGGISHVQRQIGNAVPSLITEILGREIKKQFFGVSSAAKLKLIPPLRTPLPAAEPVMTVMRKYKPVPMSERAFRDETHKAPGRHKPFTAEL